jgi:putative hydrolases of HD superfamily
VAETGLLRQLEFLLEVDRLKGVLRRSYVLAGERRENSAEHSWHLALAAMLLAEHANERVDVARVVAMALVHDIVEIDAGDTFVYDERGALDKAEREQRAAERLFALLPAPQSQEFRALWDEFEEARTAEARFAAALDRLLPILANLATDGRAWREHGISLERVLARNVTMAAGSRALWEEVRERLREAEERGAFAEEARS